MGGGDLNMKKSWHPLLLKNQERVWIEEKKALEEKKKLDQLRKEKEEERQMQELQRLQQEKTGKKQTEKLEWMYTTPATGTSQNPNDLEDYLLGKKRVDKILTADEHAKVGASHKNFIAVQNANNARDIAAKIREDPLLAIKQQEQAALQALMHNPIRLREMQERNGIKPKKDKKEKKREKEEKKLRKLERRKARESRESRSRSPPRRHADRGYSASPDRYSRSRRSPSPYRRRSRSPVPSRKPDSDYRHSGRARSPSPYRSTSRRHSPDRVRVWPKSDESDEPRSKSPDGYNKPSYNRKRSLSRSPDGYDQRSYDKRPRMQSPPRHSRSNPSVPAQNDDRAAKLAAMSSNASTMTVERQERLAAMLAKEKAELEADTKARMKSNGMGGFLSQESKKVFGGAEGLAGRIQRGRGGMVVDTD